MCNLRHLKGKVSCLFFFKQNVFFALQLKMRSAVFLYYYYHYLRFFFIKLPHIKVCILQYYCYMKTIKKHRWLVISENKKLQKDIRFARDSSHMKYIHLCHPIVFIHRSVFFSSLMTYFHFFSYWWTESLLNDQFDHQKTPKLFQ